MFGRATIAGKKKFEKCRDFSLCQCVYLWNALFRGEIPELRVPATQDTSERAPARSREDRFPPPEIPTMEAPQGASIVLFVASGRIA